MAGQVDQVLSVRLSGAFDSYPQNFHVLAKAIRFFARMLVVAALLVAASLIAAAAIVAGAVS